MSSIVPDENGQSDADRASRVGRAKRRRGPLASAAGLFAFVLNGLTGGLLIWRAYRYAPVNHWGVDTRKFWACAAVTAVWGVMELFWWRRRGRWLPILVLVSAVALAGLVFVMDYYNLLVEYELWIDRGMPAQWSR